MTADKNTMAIPDARGSKNAGAAGGEKRRVGQSWGGGNASGVVLIGEWFPHSEAVVSLQVNDCACSFEPAKIIDTLGYRRRCNTTQRLLLCGRPSTPLAVFRFPLQE